MQYSLAIISSRISWCCFLLFAFRPSDDYIMHNLKSACTVHHIDNLWIICLIVLNLWSWFALSLHQSLLKPEQKELIHSFVLSMAVHELMKPPESWEIYSKKLRKWCSCASPPRKCWLPQQLSPGPNIWQPWPCMGVCQRSCPQFYKSSSGVTIGFWLLHFLIQFKIILHSPTLLSTPKNLLNFSTQGLTRELKRGQSYLHSMVYLALQQFQMLSLMI